MELATRMFLKKKFTAYYRDHIVPAPPQLEKREFGWGTLDDKIKFRHKALASERDFSNFLRREAPFYVSYSTAYYEFPANQPMETKNWLGADLIFDLDRNIPWLNYADLEAVTEEAQSLLDFLYRDFGFNKKDVKTNFSGSKGYHIHVRSDSVRELTGEQRREIIDYITGELDFKTYIYEDQGHVFGPKKGDVGWAGRVHRQLVKLIEEGNVQDLQQIKGIGPKKATEIVKNQERILRSLQAGQYDIPEIITVERSQVKDSDPNVKRSVVKSIHSALIENIIAQTAVTIQDADKMVTIDTSRLIRCPDTIHAGSGLLAKSTDSLEGFDPLSSGLAFSKDELEIVMKENVTGFELDDQSFGQFKKEEVVRLPEFAAMYLLLKDKASISPSA